MSALLILLIGMLGDAIATRLGRLNANAVAGVQTIEVFAETSEQNQAPRSTPVLTGSSDRRD